MGNNQKFEHIYGEGHCGIRVNLNISDEFTIANERAEIGMLTNELNSLREKLYKAEQLRTIDCTLSTLQRVDTLLSKMTTINLRHNDLFETAEKSNAQESERTE